VCWCIIYIYIAARATYGLYMVKGRGATWMPPPVQVKTPPHPTVCRSPGQTLAKEVCYKNLHIFIYIYPAGVSDSTTIPPHAVGIG